MDDGTDELVALLDEHGTLEPEVTALIEIPHCRSLKVPTRVAPPTRAGLPGC